MDENNGARIIENLTNDKALVIIAVTLLGALSFCVTVTPDQTLIATSVVSGLFGIAVGKALG